MSRFINFNSIRQYASINKERLKDVPDFKTFLTRSKVIQFYRSSLRTISKVKNEHDKIYLKQWLRSDIERYRSVTDLKRIDELLSQGHAQLRTLNKSLSLSGNM
ncbi:hypothetical protein K502DRAFT_324091 [Neoconidiobolus thromboides FSU 785]|nr:hypothetical protein K502DRAFT_324091 [Neoconidiobolus thromboides FSU 785]